MMTKIMNKQRGLLAAIMALVMVFAGAAFVAAEVDANLPIDQDNDDIVVLTEDITVENLSTVSSELQTIDLNGHTLTIITNNYLFCNIISTGETKGTVMIADGPLTINKTVKLENVKIQTDSDQAIQTVSGCGLTMTNCEIVSQNAVSVYINDASGYQKAQIVITDSNLNGGAIAYTSDKGANDPNKVSLTLNRIEDVNIDVSISSSGDMASIDIGTNVILQNTTVNKIALYGTSVLNAFEDVSVNTLEFNGDAGISGTKDVVIGTINKTNGDGVLEVTGTASVQINNGGTGVTIEVDDGASFTPGENYSGNYSEDDSATVRTVDEVIEAFTDDFSEVTLKVDKAVLTENIVLEFGQTLNIIGTTLTFPTSTGSDAVGEFIYVPNGATLNIESADIRVPVIADEDAYITITKAKKMTVDGDATADLGVGYGNTLVLSNLTVPAGKSIDAYGNVIIEGNVTVQKGANFNVYAGGLATVAGNLVIEGDATVKGDMDVTGTVKVYNAEGGAIFKTQKTEYYVDSTEPDATTDFIPEVMISGTMDVLKGKTKGTTNTLDATAGIVIEGTLTVTGTLSGKVADMGTITFNGKAAAGTTTITVFDGVTLTIAAVDGEITINDKDIVDEEYTEAKGYYVSENNQVKIEDVKNVTVSVIVDETTVKVNDVSKRLISSEMTVTGTIASIDDSEDADYSEKITIIGANEVSYDDNGTPGVNTDDKFVQGKVIIGDVTLGKEVVMNIMSSNVVVAGTVTVSAKESNLTIDDGKVIDITGTIVNYQKDDVELDIDGKFNGAYYNTVDADLNETFYYTTFENAIAAVADAEDNEISISGEIEIASEVEIPAGAEVIMDNGDRMLIDVDGKLTVAVDAALTASGAYIEVDGMLVIMDKESGFEAPAKNDFIYQVYTVSGETETYSGLVLALKNAVAGDVISVVGEGKIEKSVTIPEGVTLEVPKTSSLVIGADDEKVVLTVAGTLKVDGTVSAVPPIAVDPTTPVVINPVEIEVPGVIIGADKIDAEDDSDPVNVVTLITIEDYVSFKMKIDGKENIVYSNLAYAAENSSYDTVTIYGDVSAGDVAFTMGEKASAFGITVNSGAKLSVGTMTIVGDGAVFTATGEVTGTIATAAGSVDLNKVKDIIMTVIIDEDVDGTTDVLTVSSTGLVGKMDIATGTVTVDGLTVGSSEKNVLTIGTGATLLVPSGKTLAVSAMAPSTAGVTQYYGLVVDGTLSIEKGAISDTSYSHTDTDNDGIIDDGETVVFASEILVNGTMTVSDCKVAVEGKLFVNGTLEVTESSEDEDALLTVNGAVILGTAPALGANGVLSGPIDIDEEAYVIAYAGADVSAALIDVVNDVSTAKSTEIVINGVPFMTVYVDADTTLTLADIQDYLEVEGYETAVDWADPASEDTVIGSIEKVEGTLTAAKTKLTVSAGVGLKVYIDGLAIENFKGEYNDAEGYWIQFGTHTVSFAVESGYDGANATITVNGVAVSNNGIFTVDVDDKEVIIIASGAVPAQSGSTVVVDDGDDGMALTDILLIVLVVLIVIMAIIVALRMMRS